MRYRRLTYWRAQWLGGAIPGYPSLESVLRQVLTAFPSVPASAVRRGDGTIIQVQHRRIEGELPILMHCALYDPGAEGNVVPQAAPEHTVSPLRTIPPPEDADFLAGAFVALVCGDHCLVCFDRLLIGTLRYYIQQLVLRAGLPEQATRLDFAAVANRDRIAEIVQSGVTEVGLSVTLDEFDQDAIPPDGIARRAKKQVADAMATIFGREDEVENLIREDTSNVSARLVVNFNQRKHGVIDQQVFDAAAQQVLDEEEPGVYIKLRSGSRIDAEKMKLSRRVPLDDFGTTIDYNQGWVRLEEFYAELVANGHI